MDQPDPPGTSMVLLTSFRDGDAAAGEALFARYFERLTLLARSRLSPRLARRVDPEDIVLSVYRSFFIDARRGRFVLRRGGDLWRLLASMTKHKLLHQARLHAAERRSIGREVPLDGADEGHFCVRGEVPTPEDAIALAEELERVLTGLGAFERRVMELRLQGARLSEIADDTERSERTVRRTLAQIRKRVAELMGDE